MTTLQEKKQQSLLSDAYHEYAKGLTTHAYYKVHNRDVSDDLVQDTFTKTWSYLVRTGKINTMKAFLYHTLNHLIVDEYRKHKTTSLDVLLEVGYEPSFTEGEQLANRLDGGAAMLLVKRLPEKYQRVMKMRYQQGLTIKEIALLTAQSNSTTAVQLHRGLAKLKLLYKN